VVVSIVYTIRDIWGLLATGDFHFQGITMRKELTGKEREVLQRLKKHLQTPENTHDMIALLRTADGIQRPALAPVSPATVAQAEKDLGFPLPPLLRELYLQIGDGGFGPGYGLYKLTGGETDLAAVVPNHRMATDPDLPEPYNTWRAKHLMLVDWGCNIYSAVDCASAEGTVYRYNLDRYDDETSGPVRDYGILEAASLGEWLERWMEGEDLFRAYSDPDQAG